MEDLKRQLEMIAECLPPSKFRDTVIDVTSAAIAEVERLTAEASAAYEKGAADMKLSVRVAMCEADTPFRSYDEVWQIAQAQILALPLRGAAAEEVRG